MATHCGWSCLVARRHFPHPRSLLQENRLPAGVGDRQPRNGSQPRLTTISTSKVHHRRQTRLLRLGISLQSMHDGAVNKMCCIMHVTAISHYWTPKNSHTRHQHSRRKPVKSSGHIKYVTQHHIHCIQSAARRLPISAPRPTADLISMRIYIISGAHSDVVSIRKTCSDEANIARMVNLDLHLPDSRNHLTATQRKCRASASKQSPACLA